MPFFSVIIPLYNKEQFITNTLKSVLNQTFTDFEVIIVNDGSTDNSLEKIAEFTDHRIQIYHQDNQGVSTARNKGIELAKAEYIAFLDADDIWKDNHLQSFFDVINKYPEAGLYCNRYEIKINRKKVLKTQFDFENEFEGYLTDFFKSSLINRVALTSAVCIPKHVYDKIGGFNEKITLGEDLEYWIRIAVKYQVVIGKKVTVLYNYTKENKNISKLSITKHSPPTFDFFLNYEKDQPNLKHFLDLHRLEYALHYHINGNDELKNFYLKDIDLSHINKKNLLLLKSPTFFLKLLLIIKRSMKHFGWDFNVYH